MENEENILSVLGETQIESLLTPQETQKIQSKLWDILAGRAESYTKGGSSSVRVETAQELLKSAGFVLRHAFDDGAGPDSIVRHLVGDDFDILFKAGLAKIKAAVLDGEALYERATETATAADNRAYRDTLRELGVFFKRYHYHHFAHEIPCMLDYPLARPVAETLLGIDYINEYLRRLIIENDFCSRFDAETVTLLLRGLSPDYKVDFLNICEAVLTNALALTLLKSDVRALDITDRDRDQLKSIVDAWAEGDAPKLLRGAASALCTALDIGDTKAQEYLAETAVTLSSHVRPMLSPVQLGRLFPPLYRETAVEKPAVQYIDGALMDDEMLRTLIDDVTSCRLLSDKIVLVRQNIFSLRDLTEVLNVGLYDEEIEALFDAFSDDELRELRRYASLLRRQTPDWRSETGWERHLVRYRRKQK